MLKFLRFTPDRLPLSLVERWIEIQSSLPALASPFFRPEFVQALAFSRPDLRVAVIEEGCRPVAFLAYRLGKRPCFAKPLPMCDFQGIVRESSVNVDTGLLLRGIGISAWDFNHLIEEQVYLYPSTDLQMAGSPRIDLSGCNQSYDSHLLKKRPDWFTNMRRKARKLEREHGPIEFRFRDPDYGLLLPLISEWRKKRFGASGEFEPWRFRALERMYEGGNLEFGATLSTLRARGKIIAMNLSLCSRTVLHHLFPAFDQSFHRYSPGIQLLLNVVRHFQDSGGSSVDLGKGEELYKIMLCNSIPMVARGSFEVTSAMTLARRIYRKLDRFFATSASLLRPSISP